MTRRVGEEGAPAGLCSCLYTLEVLFDCVPSTFPEAGSRRSSASMVVCLLCVLGGEKKASATGFRPPRAPGSLYRSETADMKDAGSEGEGEGRWKERDRKQRKKKKVISQP